MSPGTIRVNWRMTPGEWSQLRSVLLANVYNVPYLRALAKAGKLDQSPRKDDPNMREDHYAQWAWLILAVAVTLFVVAFDLWAHYTGHKLMTTQFRLWLFNRVTGPFIFAAWVGLFAGLSFHWFLRGTGTGK